MRIAIVSDIHGNVTALDAMIRDLQAVGTDLIVHGGDLVGNGSAPAEVIDRVRELKWPGVCERRDERQFTNAAQAKALLSGDAEGRGLPSVDVREAVLTCERADVHELT